jgi:hypothetical protein
VLPTDTFPKFREAGLALSAEDSTELGVAGLEFVELVAAEVELLLAEVTPAQPERMIADMKRVEVRKRIRARGLGYAFGSVERNRGTEFPEGIQRVYGAHSVRSTGQPNQSGTVVQGCSNEHSGLAYRETTVFNRALRLTNYQISAFRMQFDSQ